jgi:hypothetical protein
MADRSIDNPEDSGYDRVMRNGVLSLLLFVAAAASTADQRSDFPVIPNPSGFEIRRGVNLSHWLSQCFGWSPRASFVTEDDVRFIARLGYDHVRIPIDEKELWTTDGQPSEEAFGFLTRALDWCAQNRLRAIVDLHTIRSHHFNAANEGGENTLWSDPAAQENFLRLWKDIGAYIGRYPVDMVAYEIMNEAVAEDHEDWNRFVRASQSGCSSSARTRGSSREPFLISRCPETIRTSSSAYTPTHH